MQSLHEYESEIFRHEAHLHASLYCVYRALHPKKTSEDHLDSIYFFVHEFSFQMIDLLLIRDSSEVPYKLKSLKKCFSGRSNKKILKKLHMTTAGDEPEVN